MGAPASLEAATADVPRPSTLRMTCITTAATPAAIVKCRTTPTSITCSTAVSWGFPISAPPAVMSRARCRGTSTTWPTSGFQVSASTQRSTRMQGSSGSDEAVTPSMYLSEMDVTEFNFARKLDPNFNDDGKLQYLSNFGESWGFIASDTAVVFLDNHDTQRGDAQLTYKNGDLYQLANVFMLAHPYGYPKVMSSYYFTSHDQGPPSVPVHNGNTLECGSGKPWVCEHRWTPIANMIAWRWSAGSAGVTTFAAPGGDTISFCRGTAACVALNRQSTATWSVTLQFTLPQGRYCNVIQSDDTSSCPSVSVAGDGSVTLQVPPMSAVALHVGKKLSSSLGVVSV